jgi:ribosomal protein S27AE
MAQQKEFKAADLDAAGVWDEECPSCGHAFAAFHRDCTDWSYDEALSIIDGVALYRPCRITAVEDQDQWDEYLCPRCNHTWTV